MQQFRKILGNALCKRHQQCAAEFQQIAADINDSAKQLFTGIHCRLGDCRCIFLQTFGNAADH